MLSDFFLNSPPSTHTKRVVKSGVVLILSQKEYVLMPTEFAGLSQGMAASLIYVLP